jgi:hypothetical protein
MNRLEDSFDLEFHKIFDRVSALVDFKGAYGVNEVNERIERAIFRLKDKRNTVIEERRKPSKILLYNQDQLEKLLKQNRFASRVTSELIANPDGRVALTIRYGRERAKQILLRRARERRGRLRVVRRLERRRYL